MKPIIASVDLPNIRNDGTPQNECMPIAGTLDSMIRRISNFLNDWNNAPTWTLCFGFLITITLISSSNSLIGICLRLPIYSRAMTQKRISVFMTKSIINSTKMFSQSSLNLLPRSHIAEYRPLTSKSHVHSIGHFLMLLVCGRPIKAMSIVIANKSFII